MYRLASNILRYGIIVGLTMILVEEIMGLSHSIGLAIITATPPISLTTITVHAIKSKNEKQAVLALTTLALITLSTILAINP